MKFFRVGLCFLLLKRIPLLPSLTDALRLPGQFQAGHAYHLHSRLICVKILSNPFIFYSACFFTLTRPCMTDDLLEINQALQEAASTRMPFGRFGPQGIPPAGLLICELPFEYLKTFVKRGFPRGRIGELMSVVYRMKLDGAEEVFQAFLKNQPVTPRKSPRQKKFF